MNKTVMNKAIVVDLQDMVDAMSSPRCLSNDCHYYAGSGCGLKVCYLKKGICRYYKVNGEHDRTDLGRPYDEFTQGSRLEPDTD